MSDSAFDNSGWMSDASSLDAGHPTAGVPWSGQDTSLDCLPTGGAPYGNQHFASSSASLGDASSAGIASPANAPSRTHVTTACIRCRKTKGKCNGATPTCDQCAKRGNVVCTYPTTRDRRTRADPSYVNNLEDDLASERMRRQQLEEALAAKDARLEAALSELAALRQREPSYGRAQGAHPPPLSVATALPVQANQLPSEQSAGSSGHSPHVVWSPPGVFSPVAADAHYYRDSRYQEDDAASLGSCSVHSASGHASPVAGFATFAGLEGRLQELELSMLAQQQQGPVQGLALSDVESMDISSTGNGVEQLHSTQPLIVPGRLRSRSTSAVPSPDLLHPNRVPSYATSRTIMDALDTLGMPADYPVAPSAPTTTPVDQFAPASFGQELPGAGFPQTESEYAGSIQGGAPLLRRWSTTAVRPTRNALRRGVNHSTPTVSVHAPTQGNVFSETQPMPSTSAMPSVPTQYMHGNAATTFLQHPNLPQNWGNNSASPLYDYSATMTGLQMMPLDATQSSQASHDLGHTSTTLQSMSGMDNIYSQLHPHNQAGGYSAVTYDPGPISTSQTSATSSQQLTDGSQQLADGAGVDLGPVLTFTPADISHGYHHRP